MKKITEFTGQLFSASQKKFNSLALEIFRYQAKNNQIYKKYIELLKISPAKIHSVEQIPFLPIDFFKTERVITADHQLPTTNYQLFISSGTTGAVKSRHYVKDVSLYKESILAGFERFYGNPADYCIMGILPERKNSSLVFMIEYLVKKSGHPLSGFYFDNEKKVIDALKKIKDRKTILIGISFCLMDLAEKIKPNEQSLFKHSSIIETGGMKGKRKELTKTELHDLLKRKFGIGEIHSEYGMTELLSHAYSKKAGIFHCPPWMKILIRDINDPFSILEKKQTGGINIIDLANIHSCSFISAMDVGKLYEDNSFEILGRFDQSDLRGCNLLIE